MTLLLILLSISVRNRSTGLYLERSKARGLGLCGVMHVTWNLELFEVFVERPCVDRAACADYKGDECLTLMVSAAAAVAGGKHHACTNLNQGTMKRLGCTASARIQGGSRSRTLENWP